MPPAAAHPPRQGKANFGAYQAQSEPPAPSSPADLDFPPLPNKISHPPGHAAGGSPSSVSFAAVVTKPRLMQRFPPISLPRRQYGCEDGKPIVHFTTAEFEAGAALFKFSLIAKFTVGRPTMEEIRNTLKNCWVVKGRVTLSEIWDGRHIMVILDSEEDATAALTCPVRKIGHAMFRLFRYSSDYNPKRESTITTKWVRLHGLHPAFFTRAYVGAIVNSFGTFLDLDACTKTCAGMKFARACVEIDVTVPTPERVKLTLSDGRFFWQKIEVEGNISYCSYCKLHGHELAMCRKKKAPKLYEGPAERDNPYKGPNDGQEHHACTIPVTIAGNSNVSSQPSATQKDKMEWIQVKKKKAARVVGAKTSEVSLEKGVSIPSVIEQGNSEVEQASYRVTEEAATDVGSIGQHHNIVVDQLNLGESVGIISDEGNNDIDDTLALVAFHAPTNQQEETLLVEKNLTTQDEESIDPASAMILNNEQDDNILLPDLFLTNVGGQFYCEQLGGKIFQDQEEFAKFAEENGYVQEDPVEEPKKGYEAPDVIHNSANKSRQRKKKEPRSSGRSCPKKKDKNFVWS